MDKDYYAGEPTVEEQIDYQQNNSNVPFKIIMIATLVVAVALMLIFLVINLNKKTDYKELDKNNYLKSLVVSGGTLNKQFDKDEVRYVVTTDSNSVDFKCDLESTKAKVENCKLVNVVSDSFRHQIKVTAENGNVKIYYFNIVKKIVTPVRVDEVSGIPENWVDRDVILTVKASADSGLHAQAYSYDNGMTWTGSNIYRVSQNQTVKIVVRDVNGTVSQAKDVYINRIDKNVPTVSITSISTSTRATIYSNVTPAKTPSGYLYKWYRNGIQVPGSSPSLDVTQGGTYHVVVVSGTGKTAKSSTYEVRLR